MKDLDTLGVLGTQKTVFFQEPPIEYVQKIHRLEQDREILKSFIVRHHPEMEGWIRKNFGMLER